jgi:hypothetical protein
MAKDNFFKTMKRAATKKVQEILKKATNDAYQESRNYLRQEILKHPLSFELATENESSSYFSVPKGSIFGLMGFKASRKPISELIVFLDSGKGLRYISSKTTSSNVIGKLIGPSDKDMASSGLTLDGWGDGRAWPEVVEQGIPGLSNYFVSKYGRSEKGFQTSKTVNSIGNLEKIPYLSPIFRRTEKKFIDTIKRKVAS